MDGVSSGIDTWFINFDVDDDPGGGSGARRFLPKELMEVLESVDIVDILLRAKLRSRLFKLDIDTDLEGN